MLMEALGPTILHTEGCHQRCSDPLEGMFLRLGQLLSKKNRQCEVHLNQIQRIDINNDFTWHDT